MRALHKLRDLVSSELDRLDTMSATDRIPIGMPVFDELLGGLYPGELGILAAPTGIGKSSIVQLCAMEAGEPHGLIATEDTARTIARRALATASGIESLRLRLPERLCPEERSHLRAAAASFADRSEVSVLAARSIDTEGIADAVKAFHEEGCRFVWWDYVQKLKADGSERRLQIANGLETFNDALERYGMAGIAISQFRRPKDADEKPHIHMLKDSGELENAARFVWLAERDGKRIVVTLDKAHEGGEGTKQYFHRIDGVLRLPNAPLSKSESSGRDGSAVVRV